MGDKILYLFKLEYSWYEGEHQSTILAIAKEKEEIEKDLQEIANSINSDGKKENVIEYKPHAYREIVSILEQKGYMVCYFLSDPEYEVEETRFLKRIGAYKYMVLNKVEKVEWKRLKNLKNC